MKQEMYDESKSICKVEGAELMLPTTAEDIIQVPRMLKEHYITEYVRIERTEVNYFLDECKFLMFCPFRCIFNAVSYY